MSVERDSESEESTGVTSGKQTLLTLPTEWIEREEEEAGFPVDYKITSTPNDFNVNTLFDLIESETVKIPGFQRNYVWDIKKASKLIESIIMGLPVPQLFFYERGRNDFLVIDGQQRLMTIYYFIKGRFPRIEKRAELRKIFDQKGGIPPPAAGAPAFGRERRSPGKSHRPASSRHSRDSGRATSARA